jgi:hypothetical protein
VSNPGPLLKVHPREMTVRKAESELSEFMLDNEKWKELTLVEQQSVLLGMVAVCNKYLLRIDRHGDDTKPSGLE